MRGGPTRLPILICKTRLLQWMWCFSAAKMKFSTLPIFISWPKSNQNTFCDSHFPFFHLQPYAPLSFLFLLVGSCHRSLQCKMQAFTTTVIGKKVFFYSSMISIFDVLHLITDVQLLSFFSISLAYLLAVSNAIHNLLLL